MDTIIRWVEQTAVYREYLTKLPEPLNNVYFDVLILLVLTIYIVYTAITRIADRAALARMRRKARQEEAFPREGAGIGGRAFASGAGEQGGNRHLDGNPGTCFPAEVMEGRASIRQVAMLTGISRSAVQRLSKKEG